MSKINHLNLSSQCFIANILYIFFFLSLSGCVGEELKHLTWPCTTPSHWCFPVMILRVVPVSMSLPRKPERICILRVTYDDTKTRTRKDRYRILHIFYTQIHCIFRYIHVLKSLAHNESIYVRSQIRLFRRFR